MAVASFAHAQQLKTSGTSAKDIVPTGWYTHEATGDLNKDGIADLAIIATPDFKEHLHKREDGYVFNFNQPILAVYWGNANGSYNLYKQYAHIIPHPDSEYIFYEYILYITDRNVLQIGYSTFASAGSGDTGGPTFTFRFQNGDFELIGYDDTWHSRMTGEAHEESFNFSTYKKAVTTSNVFDASVKPKTKWSAIPKKPREKLGGFELDCFEY